MDSVDKKIDVSIVLAAYNEEACVIQELEIIKKAMDSSGYTYEILLVDDASKDKTAALAASVPGVRVLRHTINKGSGGARKTGTLAARGEIVVWSDVDLTYPNQDIPRLVHEMKKNGYDHIIGARTSEKGTMKLLRAPAKFFIRRLAAYLSETEIPDLNSGLRAFRRDISLHYLNLLPKGFSCVSTITLAFICNDHSVGFMPITYAKRAGRSKFHPVKDTYQYLMQVIRMIMYFNPLRIFMPLSFALCALGVVSSAAGWFFFHKIIATNIIILLVSVIVAVLGLLADLIVVQHKK